MTTQETYIHFDVPKNLQLHMLRVAGLAQELQAHWTGPNIDWAEITQAALLHDIANVIKFDLVAFPKLLGDEEYARIDYWRAKQQELIAKYGDDEHAAGDAMLTELGVSDRVRHIIDSKTFGKAKELNASPDMATKMLLYCDMRILPDGLGPLRARLDDIRVRLTKYSSRPDFPDLVAACESIEQTIQANVDAPIDSFISANSIDSHQTTLLALTIN